MTCIDSAIIKALVEHIGMNPDDVPIGGGGGSGSGSGSGSGEQSSSTFLDATWTDNGGYFKFTLPEGQKLAVGSIIRFIEKNSTISNFLVNEETKLTSSNDTWYAYIKLPIDFSNPRIFEQRIRFDGEYYELTDFYIDVFTQPDNEKTGIMSNHSYASILELLISIINGIIEVHKA